jgi:hypothetical protein
MANPQAVNPPPPDWAKRVSALSVLCGEAARHMAEARVSLGHGAFDPDGAFAHLDQALAILRSLHAAGSLIDREESDLCRA